MANEPIDKSQAVLTFLQTCPTISSNPLFFNFGDIKDNANQANIQSDDKALDKPYIDGSVLKRFTFSVDSFKAVTYIPVVNGYVDENLEGFKEVQTILDWITTQDKTRNYPIFGNNFFIDKMKTLTSKPDLVGVDTTQTPAMAIYRISIQIDYIDKSDCLWQ